MRLVAVPSRSTLLRVVIGLAAAIVLVIAGLAFLPVGRLRPQIEAALSRKLGTPVHIARITRGRQISLSPIIEIDGLSIDQPAWAGRGHWAEIDHAHFRLPLLPAFAGRLHPSQVSVDGLRLLLVRSRDGLENWSTGAGSGGQVLMPAALRIRNGRIRYRDAKRDRAFDVGLATLGDGRLQLMGTGQVLARPVRVVAQGAAITGAGTAWPFSVRIDGPTLHFSASGTMDRALDSRAMTIDLKVRADDLKTLDAIIEAGLFHSQAVDLAAHARHQERGWTVTGLRGTIGHSRLAGHVSVRSVGDRHTIDGAIVADPLDFADLSSSAHLVEQAALKRAGKQRLIPGTKVDLTKLAHTDGQLRIDARSMAGSGSGPIRAVKAVLQLDHSRLSVAPLTMRLSQGKVVGSLVSDQRRRSQPLVTIDLRLDRSDLSAFSKEGRLSGPLSGKVRLSGPGRTIGQAVGQADGTLRLRVGGGSIPGRVSAMLGLDLGRALTRSSADVSELRCAAVDSTVRHGSAKIDRMVIDTSSSQARGSGTINLADEGIAVSIAGAPKKASLVQLPGTIRITGTLAVPHVSLPQKDRSAGAVLRSIGRAIGGTQPTARDLDCESLR